MAAGDIIIPDGRLTPEILEKITSEVVNNIQTTSKDPGQYEEVDSLQGITSIPVFHQSGSTYKLVRVLLSILKGVDGKEVHLQSTETHLQWRWTNGMWENLVAWADLKGEAGDTPEFRTGLSGIEWKYVSEEEAAWKVLVTFEVLKLKFTDLTAEQIAAFWQAIPEDVLALFQKPATDAAAEVRKEMAQISQDASAAIEAANTAAGNAQDAADNVQDGKTTQFEIGTVESGAAPSASLTDNGVDVTGNPKKKLNLVMPKGDDAKSPTVQTGTITTGDPASEVTFTFTEAGTTEDGRPIWRVDGSIPRGQQGPPGAGSGNVSADGIGLVIGKKYLFVPDADDSTAGSFVEYVAPEVPEQVQPDWDATEGKGVILNKPGDATADASGLMSADQFQKLEKLNPSSLSNDVTGKKVEYTDDGKLLFEGKETFAVDADGELTLDGKKMSELGGNTDSDTFEIPNAILNITNESASDEISQAIGGIEGFNNIFNAIKSKQRIIIKRNESVESVSSSETIEILYHIAAENVEFGKAFQFLFLNEENAFINIAISSNAQSNDLQAVIDINETKLTSLPTLIHTLVGWGTYIDMTKQQYKDIADSISNNTPILYTDAHGSCPVSFEKIYGSAGELISYMAFRQGAPSGSSEYDESIKIYLGSIDKDGNKQEKRNIIKFDLPHYSGWTPQLVFTNKGDGTKALMDDGTYKEVGGDYQLPAATDSALGGIKTGYAASGNNYPVQLDGSDKAYVNVPWTDTDTTYSPATTSSNGLMSSTDKTKLDRIGSYTTATTVASLNANYENIEISNLSANASLSVNLTGTAYDTWSIYVAIYCSSAKTITIPTSGNYISMIGSSLTCPAGKWTELHLKCLGGKWRIAKLEQE